MLCYYIIYYMHTSLSSILKINTCIYIHIYIHIYIYTYIYIKYNLHMYVVEYTQLYKQATAVQPGVKKLCWQVTIHLQVVGFAFRAPLIAQPRYQQGESNSRAGGPSKRFTGPIRLPKKNLLAWVSRIFEAAKKRFILQLGRGKQARKPEKYLRFSRENRLLF